VKNATKISKVKQDDGSFCSKETEQIWNGINKQWRIIFQWDKGSSSEVEIVDYH
jgi:plasmid maintenance system killer protein